MYQELQWVQKYWLGKGWSELKYSNSNISHTVLLGGGCGMLTITSVEETTLKMYLFIL